MLIIIYLIKYNFYVCNMYIKIDPWYLHRFVYFVLQVRVRQSYNWTHGETKSQGMWPITLAPGDAANPQNDIFRLFLSLMAEWNWTSVLDSHIHHEKLGSRESEVETLNWFISFFCSFNAHSMHIFSFIFTNFIYSISTIKQFSPKFNPLHNK